MRRPPNIDEFGNLILLRQALEILAADQETQRSLYPPDRDPADEMRSSFTEAWGLVRPVFWPSLSESVRGALLEIDAALGRTPVDWDLVRAAAARANGALPGRAASGAEPRAWPDQIVRARNRLLLRRHV